jgi:hypothetical protein
MRSDGWILRLCPVDSSPKYHGVGVCSSHKDAVAFARWSVGVLRLFNLLNKEFKGLSHIHVIAGARFRPGTAQLLSEFLALFGGNLPLLWSKVALIADDTDGDLLGAL